MTNEKEQYRLNLDNESSSTSGDSNSPVEKNPDEWVTGNEPMTGPQRSYLNTLAREAGEDPVANLTKSEASKKIEELQKKTGRGANDNN